MVRLAGKNEKCNREQNWLKRKGTTDIKVGETHIPYTIYVLPVKI